MPNTPCPLPKDKVITAELERLGFDFILSYPQPREKESLAELAGFGNIGKREMLSHDHTVHHGALEIHLPGVAKFLILFQEHEDEKIVVGGVVDSESAEFTPDTWKPSTKHFQILTDNFNDALEKSHNLIQAIKTTCDAKWPISGNTTLEEHILDANLLGDQ